MYLLGDTIHELIQLRDADNVRVEGANVATYTTLYRDGVALGALAALDYVSVTEETAGTYKIAIDTSDGSFPGVGSYHLWYYDGVAAQTGDVDHFGGPYVVYAAVLDVNLTQVGGKLIAESSGDRPTIYLKLVNVENPDGHAVYIRSTSSGYSGIWTQGSGVGAGLSAVGGAGGTGIHATAGGTNYNGMRLEGGGTGKDIDAGEVDTLLDRLTALRAGYLDNLDVGDVVSTAADVSALADVIDALVLIMCGTGTVNYKVTIADPDSGFPVDGVRVWIADANAVPVRGVKTTNESGIVEFLLEAGITYYLWAYKRNRVSIQGQAFTVEAD